ERLYKSARRHPTVAGLIAAVIAITAISLIAITALWRSAERKANEANTLLARAQDAEAHARERQRVFAYAHMLARAERAIEGRDGAAALDALDACEADLRGWEHGHMMLRVAALAAEREAADIQPEALAVSPDGKYLAVGGRTGTVHVWRRTKG